jgi:hypothetical protein
MWSGEGLGRRRVDLGRRSCSNVDVLKERSSAVILSF